MNTASTVAMYVISSCFANGYPVSNLRLQKLLYFIQGNSFIEKNEAMFSDDMYAWPYGPVIPDIYFTYCGYAGAPITRIYEDISISEFDRKIIDTTIERLLDVDDWTLVDMTHEEGAPWNNHKYDRSIITKEEIKKYFINL